jgi:hypothetical protein
MAMGTRGRGRYNREFIPPDSSKSSSRRPHENASFGSMRLKVILRAPFSRTAKCGTPPCRYRLKLGADRVVRPLSGQGEWNPANLEPTKRASLLRPTFTRRRPSDNLTTGELRRTAC